MGGGAERGKEEGAVGEGPFLVAQRLTLEWWAASCRDAAARHPPVSVVMQGTARRPVFVGTAGKIALVRMLGKTAKTLIMKIITMIEQHY